ncbi:MAG: hypothetical protein JW814_06920 [Candidatus Krumholzibacteriota bacterium]|nr:hypothetical protein [Candidatus Krumholzibacteriota bacterium]
MTDCKRIEICPFFNAKMKNMPAMAELYRNDFCRGDYSKCARLKLLTRNIPVPEGLSPNNIMKADRLIEEYSRSGVAARSEND